MYKNIVGPSATIEEITLVYLGQVELHLSGTGFSETAVVTIGTGRPICASRVKLRLALLFSKYRR